ncbi:hypothetical protein Tco_0653672 [Tanacetum coccineum]|uniref:Uncharacterized protein n=1 Tax=Tanacetum coccineum TaxID=301880 RepID=A0ABQ4X133_9ASTR
MAAPDFPTDIPTISHLSSSSISIPYTEFTATSIIHALSIEFTATPHVLSTAPVHVTSTPITSTTPNLHLTSSCNRVTARKRFRHPPAGKLAPLVPSSLPSGSSSHSLAGPSRKRRRSSVTSVTIAAHTPAAIAPARVDLLPILKRVRGSDFDYEASVEDGMEADAEADSKVDAEIGVEAKIEAEAEKSDGDTIEIRVDVVHPEPDTPAVFPVSTIVRLEEIKEELRVQGERENVAEGGKISLRAMVRSLEIIESRLRDTVRGERRDRARTELHLGLV